MNCPKCNNPLQATFTGIEHAWVNPVREETKDGSLLFWYVCINPKCEDGKHNCPTSEPFPF